MAKALAVTSAVLAWLTLSHVATVHAQVFAEYPLSTAWPGISATCGAALNTTVQCSGILPVSAENNQPRLNAENLTSLCTAGCLTSLRDAKQTIQAACTLATDVITLDEGTFPATYLVDLFTYTYGINCRVDSTTQQYCDVLLGQWLNQPSLTAAQNCSDCMLGVYQMQLNSPFGYDDAFASDFASLTASCSKTTYPFTSPAPYTASATATPSPAASPALDPGCVTLYTIRAGDTCNSIAVSQNVSTWAVYGASGIRDCSNLPTGSSLCLQGQCWLYQVKETDTCDSIIAVARIKVSPSTFVAWNPNINPVCTNLFSSVGDYICLSRPTGLTVPNITIPDATAAPTVTSWPTVAVTVTPQLPIAPGTETGCTNYVNYKDTTVYDSLYQPQSPLYTYIANQCSYVAASNDIAIDYLLEWNPSLGPSQANCSLAAGYSYCVALGNDTGILSSESTECLSVNASMILPGTSASCNCYTQYSGYDAGFVTCSTFTDSLIFSRSHNLTLAHLQAWNPWLGADCDAGLFANLTGEALRALCVGTGNVTSTSSQLSTSTSSTSLASSSSVTKPTSTSSTTGSTRSSSSSLSQTTSSTKLSTSSSLTTSSTRLSTSSSSSASPSAPGSVCVSGTYTTNANQQGLCQFSCNYGYCPAGPCTCLSYGPQVPLPPATGVAGYPLAGEDQSFLGLCSFTYNYGYYPTTACTSHADGSPQ